MAFLFLFVASLLFADSPTDHRPGGLSSAPDSAESCEIEVVHRGPLSRVGSGERLYVQPLDLAFSGSSLLVVGEYNYVFEKTASGGWKRRRGTTLLGAVVDARTGAAEPVRNPFPDEDILFIDVIGRERGWSILLLTHDLEGNPILRHGSWTDGQGSWERLPLPAGRFRAQGVSRLVEDDGRLLWMAPVELEAARASPVLWTATREGWEYEVMDSEASVSEVSFDVTEGRMVMATVSGDRSGGGTRIDVWIDPRSNRRVSIRYPQPHQLQRISIRRADDDVVLAWQDRTAGGTGDRHRLYLSRFETSREESRTTQITDGAWGRQRKPSLHPDDAVSTLAVNHIDEDGAREVLVFRVGGDAPDLVGSIPHGFISRAAFDFAHGVDREGALSLAIAGGSMAPAGDHVYTELIVTEILCRRTSVRGTPPSAETADGGPDAGDPPREAGRLRE